MIFSSCILIPSGKPLNPRLLFTVGSEFLNGAESVALKGDIEYEDDRHNDSGTFTLIMTGGDSLAFLVEGPFKVDVFRLIIADHFAYAMDRESGDWTVEPADENLSIPDYGIDGVTPEMFKYSVLPQYYLGNELFFDPRNSVLETDTRAFQIISSSNNKSFTLSSPDLDLLIIYGKRRDIGTGYYPSKIEIAPFNKSWSITLTIDKIRINPSIPSSVWDRD